MVSPEFLLRFWMLCILFWDGAFRIVFHTWIHNNGYDCCLSWTRGSVCLKCQALRGARLRPIWDGCFTEVRRKPKCILMCFAPCASVRLSALLLSLHPILYIFSPHYCCSSCATSSSFHLLPLLFLLYCIFSCCYALLL